ncbi:MAG: protein tyrosine phosphatase family protein [Planctomycetales bacterium]|nr:protein tyrosine phosphatase family protein [Planctomycetales bacterium]
MVAFIAAIGCGDPPADPGLNNDAVSASVEEPAAAPAIDAPSLREADLGAAQPAHRAGNVYLSGQPAPEDLAKWAELGVKTVISLRTDGEIDWDEAQAVGQQGMTFVSLPFRGADALTDEVFNGAREILRKAEDEPVVLHCASSNRVGAVWMAHRVLDEGVDVGRAEREAREAGLRSDDLLARARQYIEQHSTSPAPAEATH